MNWSINNPVPLPLTQTNGEPTGRQVKVLAPQVETFTGPQTGMSQEEETRIFKPDKGVRAIQPLSNKAFERSRISLTQMTGNREWAD